MFYCSSGEKIVNVPIVGSQRGFLLLVGVSKAAVGQRRECLEAAESALPSEVH